MASAINRFSQSDTVHSAPLPKKRLIEISPPASPEANSEPFLDGYHYFKDAEVLSSQEERAHLFKKAIYTFEKIKHSQESFPEAYFLKCLCQVRLAENQDHPDNEISLLEDSLVSLRKIENPEHPYFLDSKFWQGYCICRLLEKMDLEPEHRLEEYKTAIHCFSQITSPDHFHYQECRYREGLCYYKLAEEEKDQKEKLSKLHKAQNNLSQVSKMESPFYPDAKFWYDQCVYDISQL